MWQTHGDPNITLRPRRPGTGCSVAGCESPRHAHGFCSKHGDANRRHGDPLYSCDRQSWDSHLVKRMWHLAKARATKFNLPFALTQDMLVVPVVCPILGIPLAHGVKKFTDNSPSLDRIKPEKGYVTGNVQVISMLANRIKTNATTEQIRKVADYLEGLEIDIEPSVE
jgi:hypothetical protein